MSGPEMAAVKLTATIKSPRERLTVASLRAALDELEAVANVPAGADLNLVHYQQGGWELTAKWLPDVPEAAADNPIHTEIRPGARLDEDAVRAIQRRLQENPQP